MRTVVLDTNVLLSDPGVLLSFDDAEVVIPETVLGELDKLKTSRVDPDLRFRGREVSRVMFELSEQGSLVGGVELPDGGTLRVLPLDSEMEFPEELSTKNADDRILAVAVQLQRVGKDVVLVTNDLNMLLKAQTLDVRVARHFDGADSGFAKRWIIRPFQRYKVPLGILAMAVAMFAAIVLLLVFNPLTSSQQGVPQEFKDQLTTGQRDVLDQLLALQRNPNDMATEAKLANTYFNLAQSGHINNAQYAAYAVEHYQHVLQRDPDNFDVRTDLAIMEFTLGQTDQAIQDTVYVLQRKPDHLQANYNLGIFYWQGRGDLKAAEAQFNKVVELTRNDKSQAQVLKDAQARLASLKAQQQGKASGTATSTGGFK
jgi:rRNA-processing protein FCF1/cytochrome c-type biogenesis protein CcmH/NrfG